MKILDQYSDFVDIFSDKKALVLSKQIEFNKHTMDLKDGKQPPYKPIYYLVLVELETLKTYIETHLKTRFTQSSNCLLDTSILFGKKSDYSFRLYVDYQGLNNLTIKNRYPLPLIGESLDQLSQIKRFI